MKDRSCRHPQPSGGGGTPPAGSGGAASCTREVVRTLRNTLPHVFIDPKMFIFTIWLSAKQSDGEHAVVCGLQGLWLQRRKGQDAQNGSSIRKGIFLSSSWAAVLR